MKLTVDQAHVELEGTPALQGADLEVLPGTVVGLVGPNGSGETTLLRTIYRSLRPSTGIVKVGEDDVRRLAPAPLPAAPPPSSRIRRAVPGDRR